jgi:hypothetical protein
MAGTIQAALGGNLNRTRTRKKIEQGREKREKRRDKRHPISIRVVQAQSEKFKSNSREARQ